jgi:hypothetical protein
MPPFGGIPREKCRSYEWGFVTEATNYEIKSIAQDPIIQYIINKQFSDSMAEIIYRPYVVSVL